MTPSKIHQLKITCRHCGRMQTLVLSDDIANAERITCSGCKKETARLGDLLLGGGSGPGVDTFDQEHGCERA